jgi:hypothetical protein
MELTVREMTASETGIIIGYFQKATPEFLENARRRSGALPA